MDSDRRHDLEHNALDSELSKAMVFFKLHGNRIFWAVMIMAMVFIVLLYAKNHRQRNQILEGQRFQQILQPPAADAELTMAQQKAYYDESVAKLVDFADTAKDRLLGSQAIIIAGNRALEMYLDPTSRRNEQLDLAEDIFNSAKTDFADQPLIVAQAMSGLGVVAENRYDFAAAREHYTALLATPGTAGTPAAEVARQRIEMLSLLAEPVIFDTTMSTNPGLDPMLPVGGGDWSFPEMDGLDSRDFSGDE